jgi:glutaryl-CoA dehydrogenase
VIATDAWDKAEFPFEVISKYKELELTQYQYPEYSGYPGYGSVFQGFLSLALARADASFAVAAGAHTTLGMGSIFYGGSKEQVERLFPAMMEWEKIGCFAMTEPESGSDVAGGMSTTARKDGNKWILNGQKRWIGDGTWADYIITFARDEADKNVKVFLVEKGTPGVVSSKIEGKVALRTVQNADIALTDVIVGSPDVSVGWVSCCSAG